MDARLILSALQILESDFSSRQLQNRLSNLAATASAAAAAPADAAAQTAFSTAAEETLSATRSACANQAPLSLRKAIETLALTHLVGESIEERLQGILSRTPFLLTQASQDITSLQQQLLTDLKGYVTEGIAFLSLLGIKPLQSDSLLAEVGILLPTPVVKDDLIAINKHLKEWGRVICNFVELTSGKPPSSVKLAAVSSGSFEVYLNLDLEGAKAIALVIVALVGGFKAVSRARQNRAQMESDKYPQEVIDGARAYEEKLLDMAVEEATEMAIKRASPDVDKPRLPELRTLIKRHVHFMAKSISDGVDVQVSPPQISKEQAEPSATANIEELGDLGKQINTLTRTLTVLPQSELDIP